MMIRLSAAALLIAGSLAVAGCSNNDASPSASAQATVSASAPASSSPASAEPSGGGTASAPASSGEASPTASAGEAQAKDGILISLPSGNEFKPYMQLSDENAAQTLKLLDGADWEKKEGIAMQSSPTCKLSKLDGDRTTDIYYLFAADAAAYELVKETGGEYAKLSKSDSAALAKLLPLPKS